VDKSGKMGLFPFPITGFFSLFSLLFFNFHLFFIFLNMKPLSLEAPCLLVIQIQIQAVCVIPFETLCFDGSAI
jgi:hypothetical protein